ncbi:MAG: hypothetical protein LBR92_01805, partial [Puniceicoccales bacterium]|nr:hypothetical protein [Puniceicoccales bacterium]
MSTNLNLRALDFTFDQLESKSKKTKKNVEKTCISNSGLAFKITAKRVNDTSNPLGFLGLRKKTAYTVTLLSSKFAETCSQAIHNGTKESVMKIINSRQKKFSQMSSTNRAFAMQEQANQLLQSGKSEQALQLLTQSRDILQTPEGKKNFEANPS